MITSKQRAYLRGLANTIDPIFNIGKGGISDIMIAEINLALEKRELMKIKILNNSDEDPRAAAQEIAAALEAEVVQVIGSKFVIYRQSKEEPEIVLPR